jgi:CubicO group peptidase (beta-lactamase class C family)
MQRVSRTLAFLSLTLTLTCALSAGELAQGTPESAGLSAAKLAVAEQGVQDLIEKQTYAGAITLVLRNEKIVEWRTYGMADLAKGKPMRKDTIFRIHSMTKPIVTVAAMVLYDEGKVQLDDPVSKYLPELKGLRVHIGPGSTTEPARREITIRDLMRHTSGFTNTVAADPVDQMYRQKKLLDRNISLQEFVSRLGTLPLKYQPGTKFNYGVSVDVLGRVVEVVSGRTLDVFLAERIFKPLDMVDSGFFVPAEKVERFAVVYGPGPGRRLRIVDDPPTSEYLKLPRFLSGSGGLVSTARDYARFCQMLINGGELDGTRILKGETVAEMTRNQLPAEALPMTLPTLGAVPDTSLGFGLGFGLRTRASASDPSVVAGEYFWGGYASTGFVICPRDQTAIISLAQFEPLNTTLFDTFKQRVNAAK